MLKIYDALKVAGDLLEQRQPGHMANYRLTASRVNDQWVFWFVFLPETPGMDITVFVNDDETASILQGI
ncbi:MAG TPA: hypothetical protein VKK31_29745 [Thermoanaerobaculia bacterium]|nr:hypothetical protein [Thermoanaerobaculia bacterium]